MTGIIARVVGATQPVGDLKEGAEKGGAIVVDQRDEPGLLHEAAEFDQMAGALAACLGPVAHVGAGSVGGEPMALDDGSFQQPAGDLQVVEPAQ
jgi:hypothetical protein